jgi:hypothetical protein
MMEDEWRKRQSKRRMQWKKMKEMDEGDKPQNVYQKQLMGVRDPHGCSGKKRKWTHTLLLMNE